jgi:hypothetical protein
MFQFNISPSHVLVLVIKLILISGNFNNNSILRVLKVFKRYVRKVPFDQIH